ncbi:hypothetical protein CF319_g1702 [Tilletia indica]|nr:hypothetical protein CF319_g1702 [Tilletia indica]
MATTSSHNRKSSAVKRILSEAKELAADPSTEYNAQPLESNIFEWHFTIRGPPDTEFTHGTYHGRILLPPEYPFRPPNLMLLTPNGRWELNKKICLSFTGYHEEMWQPAWGIRTALLGMQSLMAARAKAAIGIGALDYPEEERKRLALKSNEWSCPICAATCAQLLGSAERPLNVEKGAASLPEGLSVDADAETRKAKEAVDASATAPSSAGQVVSSTPSPTPLLTPSNSTSLAADDAPSGTSTPQIIHSEITPHSVITRSHRGSSTESGAGVHAATTSLHRHHQVAATPAPRMNADVSSSSSSGPRQNTNGSSDRMNGPERRMDASSSIPQQPHSANAALVNAAATAVATRTAAAATSPEQGQLAIVDRCIAALTLLIGVLLLRMIVL